MLNGTLVIKLLSQFQKILGSAPYPKFIRKAECINMREGNVILYVINRSHLEMLLQR